MTNRMTTPPDTRKVIFGVDTHTHVHVAVAIDSWGIRLRDQAFVADSGGYQALITWAETHGRIEAFGIEGTGSYGAGLARAVRRARHRVVEVNRGDRRTRRAAGKSDTIDAEVAARSVLAGQSTAIPKTADGAVEMMRQLKITRDTAVQARTMAMHTLQQIIVHAPPVLREALHDLTDHGLLTRCAGLRPGPIDTPTASATHTLRALARRWMALTDEILIHDQHLARLTTETSPTLREGFGVGAHTAAELLIIFGDNPDRIRSDAAFAKLCGACPIPASSGMTTGRHRLNRGGHRQANAALYRAVIVRMRFHQPTRDYVARRTADGRTKREIIRCLKCFLAQEIYGEVFGVLEEALAGGILAEAVGEAGHGVWGATSGGRPASDGRRVGQSTASLTRAKDRIRHITHAGRGRNIRTVIDEVNRFTRGWVGYFRLATVTDPFDKLDQWIRRRLRKILWEQWKKPQTRCRKMVALGLEAARARKATATGRGAWWNAGASHMHAAVNNRLLAVWGLLNLLTQLRDLQRRT